MIGSGHFLKDEDAGATVEFVAIIGPMMLLVFFIFEVMVEMVWIGTAEKAAQAGARLSVVSNMVASGLPTTKTLNTGNANAQYGQACSIANVCTPITTTVCTGAAGNTCSCTGAAGVTCSTTDFTRIVNRMHDIFGLTQSQYVRITYTDSGLGFAGGPLIPMVKVDLQNVPYGGVVTGLISNLFNYRDANHPSANGTNGFASTLPTVSVTLTGEDLSS